MEGCEDRGEGEGKGGSRLSPFVPTHRRRGGEE